MTCFAWFNLTYINPFLQTNEVELSKIFVIDSSDFFMIKLNVAKNACFWKRRINCWLIYHNELKWNILYEDLFHRFLYLWYFIRLDNWRRVQVKKCFDMWYFPILLISTDRPSTRKEKKRKEKPSTLPWRGEKIPLSIEINNAILSEKFSSTSCNFPNRLQ